LSLPTSLTFDPTSSISSPASSEVLDPVSLEIPDFISPIPDLSDENIHETPIHDYLEELEDSTRVCEVCPNILGIKEPGKWSPGTSLSTISRHFESKYPSLYRDFKQKNAKVTHSSYSTTDK
ncbi:3242_t:CDS:2, partial [Dentiscutata erythropus]